MKINPVLNIIFAFLLIIFTRISYAEHSHQHIKVMGIDVYLVVTPVELIRGYAKDHPKSLMHSQERNADGNQSHITIGVLEESSGRRIQNLEVSANIIAHNYTGPSKKMDKMTFQDEPSYGNYFVIPSTGTYQVKVTIKHTKQSDALIVTFEQAQV